MSCLAVVNFYRMINSQFCRFNIILSTTCSLVYTMLNCQGTETNEGIALDMPNISEVRFNPATFQNMSKLRVINIVCSNENKKCKVCISPGDHDLQFLPNSLRFLHCEWYPWKSFPSSCRPQYPVEISLPYSKVNKLWEGSLVSFIFPCILINIMSLTKILELF